MTILMIEYAAFSNYPPTCLISLDIRQRKPMPGDPYVSPPCLHNGALYTRGIIAESAEPLRNNYSRNWFMFSATALWQRLEDA